ncbi:MAG: gamma carbonic anhydrase family protein [Nitrososphaerales archaeon]
MVLVEFNGKKPRLGKDVYVDPTARILGDVELGDNSAVWFGCLVKGEGGVTKIGSRSVVMEQCFVEDAHLAEEVLVSHRSLLHRCIVESRVLIGIGAVILDGAQIGEGSIIGAGSLVTAGTKIPKRCVAYGSPAKVFREIGEKDEEMFKKALDEVAWKTSRYKIILSGSFES